MAVVAELNGLIGDIQNVKAEGARELRRRGVKVDPVPTVEALIIEAEKQNE
jgi:hypothetical protein